MGTLKVLVLALAAVGVMACDRDMHPQVTPISGVTIESPLTKDYCAGIAAGGLLDNDQRGIYKRCHDEGLLDE